MHTVARKSDLGARQPLYLTVPQPVGVTDKVGSWSQKRKVPSGDLLHIRAIPYYVLVVF